MTQEKDACGVGFIYNSRSSHDLLKQGIQALCNLEHRGAVAYDNESGDGAGVMTAIPWNLFESEGLLNLSHSQTKPRALGMIFLPKNYSKFCKQFTEHFLKEEGLEPLAWRAVPTQPEVLGEAARVSVPDIEQIIIGASAEISQKDLERRLYQARRRMSNFMWSQDFHTDYFVVSMSSQTVVYKAMVQSDVLAKFYTDLNNPLFSSNFIVFHRRFSTNTHPRWWLAQPFRFLAHNGEINTLTGNRIWTQARAGMFEQAQLMNRNEALLHPEGSDSANMDNLVEIFLAAGLSPEATFACLMPQTPGIVRHEDSDFFETSLAFQEPWDGPALVVFCDGNSLGAILDRNGLRPARYALLTDGSLILCSEAGAVEIDQSRVLELGRLGPGQLLCVNLEDGQISFDKEKKDSVIQELKNASFLQMKQVSFQPGEHHSKQEMDSGELLFEQLCAGYGKEDLEHLKHMSMSGKESVWSMGDDSTLPVLSNQPRVIFDHFRQRFAQVTNPPIDSIRERLVMSLETFIGKKPRLLGETEKDSLLIRCKSPILAEKDLQNICALEPEKVGLISTLGDLSRLDDELLRLCSESIDLVKAGKTILLLSDRGDKEINSLLPILCTVGAIHHFLIGAEMRNDCSIIVETSQCWSPHQFACLLGYGAQAICPYLAWETVRSFSNRDANHQQGPDERLNLQLNYRKSLEDSLLKVMSKMGVSVLASYIGAQLFEAVGLHKDVISRCFAGTASHLGAMTFADIGADMQRFKQIARTSETIVDYGHFRYRESGEFHGNNPKLIKVLHKALGIRDALSEESKLEQFKEYSEQIRGRPPAAVRDLVRFYSDRKPISLSEVEPAAAIVRRFCTGGMSLGAISPEMHETLAIAMNRIGGRSNSGEGGEDPRRYRATASEVREGKDENFPGLRGLRSGDRSASAIRQVASGRFGVTPEYLATANQIEIKIAQGAKPGEGGQLPGDKVTKYISQLRRSRPGVTLISPPPHHDIYSIEDLAQLIFDLRQVNPRALLSVKLVSSSGIGTIASGVAKAKADIIQISGHEGGTGASPVSSIKHAGLPWEIGLAEVHQTLLQNNLRDRVCLRVDGGLRTGFDVVVAALLGAEEYGFGSLVLIAAGCIMARVCHTNNCPVGVASQKESLRSKFSGTPEQIIQLLLFIAEECRLILSQLGYRSLAEIIGRVDLLQCRDDLFLSKAKSIDLSKILAFEESIDRSFIRSKRTPHSHPKTIDDLILADPEVQLAIETSSAVGRQYKICNRDRASGSRIAGHIAEKYGDTGFAGNISLSFNGSAGQSFGGFCVSGLNMTLNGEANDYVGKGMAGGRIVLKNENVAGSKAQVLAGNACLYGATGGEFFCAGKVGERFAVRNAGAHAVLEGVGEHGCEYMTGGCVIILGSTGNNFGAGMTDGIAFVLDENNEFEQKMNQDVRQYCSRLEEDSAVQLRYFIEMHLDLTGSKKAAQILKQWQNYSPRFWQIRFP